MTAPTNIYIYKNDPRSCKCGKCGKMCAVFLEEDGLNIDGFDTISPKNVFIGKIEGNDENGVADNAYIKFKNEVSGYTTIGSSNIEKISDFMYRVIPQCNCWYDQLTGRKPATVLLCDNNLVCDKCGIKIQKNIDANICAGGYGAYNYTFVRRETDLETQSLNSITVLENDFTENAVLILTNLVPLEDDQEEEVPLCCNCDENGINKEIFITDYYPNIDLGEYKKSRININSRDVSDMEKSRYKFYMQSEQNPYGKAITLPLGTIDNLIENEQIHPVSNFINYGINIDLLNNVTTKTELLNVTNGLSDWFNEIEINTEVQLVDFVTNNSSEEAQEWFNTLKNENTAPITNMETFKAAYSDVFFSSTATNISTLEELDTRMFYLSGGNKYNTTFANLNTAKAFFKQYWLCPEKGNKAGKEILCINKISNPLFEHYVNIYIEDNEIDACNTVEELINLLYEKGLLLDFSDIDETHIHSIVELMKRYWTSSYYIHTQEQIDNICRELDNKNYIKNRTIINFVDLIKNNYNNPSVVKSPLYLIINNTKEINTSQKYDYIDLTTKILLKITRINNKINGEISNSIAIDKYMTFKDMYKQNLLTSIINTSTMSSNSILGSTPFPCFDLICNTCKNKYIYREDLKPNTICINDLNRSNTYALGAFFQKNEACSCVNGGLKVKYNAELAEQMAEDLGMPVEELEMFIRMVLNLDLDKEYPCYISSKAYDFFGEEEKSYPVIISYQKDDIPHDPYITNLKSDGNIILTKNTSENIQLAWQITTEALEDVEGAIFAHSDIENEYITSLGYTTQWNNENYFDNANNSLYFDNLIDNTSDSIYAPVVSIDSGCGSYGISNSILGPWDEDGNNMNENGYSSNDVAYYNDTDKKNSFNYRYAIEVGHLDYLLGSYVAPEPTPTPTPDNKYVIRYYYNDFDYNFTSSIVYSNTIDVSHIKKK